MSIEGEFAGLRREINDKVKAAFERGYAQGAGEGRAGQPTHAELEDVTNDLRGSEQAVRDLQAKLDREVAAHRTTAKSWGDACDRATKAEGQARQMAKAFLVIHDLAKEIVGPKTAGKPS